VMDYAATGSPRRDAQMARLPDWTGTTWDAHLGSVLDFVERTESRGSVRTRPANARTTQDTWSDRRQSNGSPT
jgi:hypothetical protein